MARTIVSVAIFGLVAGASRAVIVTSPSEQWTVTGDRPYVVEWTSTAAGRGGSSDVAIDLYYCGDNCRDDECGEWVANLCAGDCEAADGAHEVLMPTPLEGTSWGYKVQVTDGRSSPISGCSDEFRLVTSDDTPAVGGEVGGTFVTVTSPVEGDLAVAGEHYTVEFFHGNGMMSAKDDRFMVDLYLSREGNADCGLWVGSLCDDPAAGCTGAERGRYDIKIPAYLEADFYSIRVARAGKHGYAADCSGEFEVAPAARLVPT